MPDTDSLYKRNKFTNTYFKEKSFYNINIWGATEFLSF